MATILHVIDTTGPGGAETIFLQLAQKSAEKGHRSIALIRGKGWVHTQLKQLNIANTIIDCKGSLNIRYLRQLIQLIKSENIDIIQSHLLGSNVYCAIAGILTNTRVIATFHGSVDISPNERFRHIKLLALRFGCYRIITVTKRLERIFCNLPIIKKSTIRTIYNGIDTSQFKKIDASDFRESLDINRDAILIGSLGNIRKAKNYPLAIKTLSEIHKRGIKAHYAIAGQGNEQQMAPLIKLINQYSLGKYVHLLGFTQNTQAFLSSLDVFLMSSSSEGHPLALTQAMINGLPIVSTPSGIEEIVSNNEEALISTEHDALKLAALIQQVIENSEQGHRIATKAKNKAEKLYSLQNMFNAYFKYYQTADNIHSK